MKNYQFGLKLSLTLSVTIRSNSKSDKDDDYRMANIFTRRCSSKIVPEIRILNSLSFETAELYGTEYNSWSALLNYRYNQKLLQIYKKLRRLQSIVGVYKILQTPASNLKAQTLARNIYFKSDLNS